MTITEATTLKNEYIKKLVGKPYDGRRPDWAIKDVIVSDAKNAANVYRKMFGEKMSNEKALGLFDIPGNDYDAWIIAHEWPWDNGDIHVEAVHLYLNTAGNKETEPNRTVLG